MTFEMFQKIIHANGVLETYNVYVGNQTIKGKIKFLPDNNELISIKNMDTSIYISVEYIFAVAKS